MSDTPEDPRSKFRRPLTRPSTGSSAGLSSGPGEGAADGAATVDRRTAPRPPARSGSASTKDGKGDRPAPREGKTNLPAVRESSEAVTVTASPATTGVLARVLDVIGDFLKPQDRSASPKAESVPSAPAEPPVFTVSVASISGDAVDGAASFALFKLLENRSCLKVRQLARPFVLNNADDAEEVTVLGAMLAQALRDEDADLLIWGEVNPREGYRLYMAAGTAVDADNTSPFTLTTQTFLPSTLGDVQADMLYGAVLTAVVPATPIQRGALRRLLPPIATTLEQHAQRVPAALTPAQQRSLLTVYGHVASTNAAMGSKGRAGEWYLKATEAYRAAESRLGVEDPEWETGLIARHLALSYSQWAEKSQDTSGDFLEQSVNQWRRAVSTLSRTLMPGEWAQAQIKLGQSLYRLDMQTGDINLLRESVQVLQSALQIHTRVKSPHRWTEIMHSLALVLQVYGDQLHNTEVLQRAVDSARLVLEVRTRERSAIAWAAAQNTLGGSLFLLGKHTGDVKTLEEAGAVFREALAVFRSQHNSSLAQVANRNLTHVEQALTDLKNRPVMPDPLWVV